MARYPRGKVPPDADPALSRRAINLQAAATHLCTSIDFLRDRIADGSLPAFKLGYNMVRVYVDDLEALKQPVRKASNA